MGHFKIEIIEDEKIYTFFQLKHVCLYLNESYGSFYYYLKMIEYMDKYQFFLDKKDGFYRIDTVNRYHLFNTKNELADFLNLYDYFILSYFKYFEKYKDLIIKIYDITGIIDKERMRLKQRESQKNWLENHRDAWNEYQKKYYHIKKNIKK